MNMNYSNMTVPQLLMMLNPGAANTTYMQPDQEAMLRNQSISPYTPQGDVQMPNMQNSLNIEGLLGSLLGVTGVQATPGSMTEADATRMTGYQAGAANRGVPSQRMLGSGQMTEPDAEMLRHNFIKRNLDDRYIYDRLNRSLTEINNEK